MSDNKKKLYPEIITTSLLIIILYLRESSLAGKPYLISEDGTIFIQRAIDNGMGSIIQSYAGYYHFIPQLIVLIIYKTMACFNNIKFLPNVMRLVSVVIEAAIVSYFVSDTFSKVIRDKKYRLICCILVMLLCPSELVGIYGTLTNLQWWCGYYLFLIALSMFTNGKLPSWRGILVIILVSLSAANAIYFDIFFIALAVHILVQNKKIKTAEFAKIIFVLLPGMLQFISVMNSGRGTIKYVDLTKIYQTVPSYFNILGKIITPDMLSFSNIRLVVCGILCLCLMVIVYKKNNNVKLLWFGVLYSWGIYLFCILPIDGNSNNEAIISGNYMAEGGYVGGRYWFITFMILELMIAILVVKILEQKRFNGAICTMLISYIMIICVGKFEVCSYITLFGDYTTFYKEAASRYDRNGEDLTTVMLENDDWYFEIPCRK